jgi:Protein of unknown function (DUF768)
VGRETGPEYDAGDGWAVMSKRFLRWVETWIEENIPPGANPDIESHEARAERLTEKLFAEAAAANFSKFETEEERERVSPRVLAAVADSRDWDVDAYVLKSQLAQENEDGD